MIKRLIILAVVLLLVGGIGSLYTAKSQKKEVDTLEEVIEASSFGNIYLDTDNAEITLISTTDEQAKVELIGNQTEYEFTTDVVDNTLEVNLKYKQSKIFSFDIFSTKSSLNIYVPEKVYDIVQVKTNNGSIELADIEGSELEVDTNNGKITLNNVRGNRLSLESDNGRIEMENVIGEIAAETDNGSITLVTDDLDRPIDLYTDNGKIDIHSKEKPTNAMLDIKVDTGTVSVFGEKDWDTKIGNGHNTIKLRSANGSITLSH